MTVAASRRSCSPLNSMNRARRVMLDPINDSEQIKPLNRLFGTHGIDYTPVQGYNPYTHLVSVCSPPQGYRPDFLIKTNQLLPFDVTGSSSFNRWLAMAGSPPSIFAGDRGRGPVSC